MRVPTYRRQTGITSATGARQFSVQASPSGLSQGLRAVGAAVAGAEQATFSYFELQNKMRRENELAEAEFTYKTGLQEDKVAQQQRDPDVVLFGDDTEDSFETIGEARMMRVADGIKDKRVRASFIKAAREDLRLTAISVNQDARNRQIDKATASQLQLANTLVDKAVMGNAAERSSASLKLFGGVDGNGQQVIGIYDQMAEDGLIKATDAVKYNRSAETKIRDRTQKAEAAILDSNVSNRVLVANDPRQPMATRVDALRLLEEDVKKGIDANAIDESGAAEIRRKAYDDVVRGTAMNLMTASDSAQSVALQISMGLSDDDILNNALKLMDPSDRIAAVKSILETGDKIDTQRREQAEAAEEKADQANVNMFDAIINVDTTNENSMALALDMHKQLLQRNWYNATQRKAAEAILGLKKPTQSGEKVETSAEAIKVLNRADNDNILTLDLVDQYAGQLSPSDYNAFFKRAIAEGKDGRTAAKGLISSKLRYNEFKDSNNALGDAADMMFQQSMFELDDWLNTSKADDGGQGASYQEVVTKARDINEANETEYQKQMKEAFISYLQSSQTLVPNLPVDLDDPIGAAKAFLATQNQSDPIIRGITQTIQSYVKIGVR